MTVPAQRPYGVFVGLATLDTVYRVDAVPGANTKVVALGQELAAGGPAANAAVAFAALGGRPVLVTALGRHPLARYVAAELADRAVEVIDATPDAESAPAVSSIYVVDATGDRSVVSVNSGGSVAPVPRELGGAIAGAGVLLVDGHHQELALAAARLGRECGVPVVLDGGSWKPVLDQLLPVVDVAVCSANFQAPAARAARGAAGADAGGGAAGGSTAGCGAAAGAAGGGDAGVAAELHLRGVPAVAVTHGGEPIRWWAAGQAGTVEVPRVAARDTLGAGDAFHGAFAYAMAASPGIPLPAALGFAARVAALRCGVPGPRAWLTEPGVARLGRSLLGPAAPGRHLPGPAAPGSPGSGTRGAG